MGFRRRITYLGWTAGMLLAACGCPSSSEPAKPKTPETSSVTQTQPQDATLPELFAPAKPNLPAEPVAAQPALTPPPPADDPFSQAPLVAEAAEENAPDLQLVSPDPPIGRQDTDDEPARLPEEPAALAPVSPDVPDNVALVPQEPDASVNKAPTNSMFQRHDPPRGTADDWDANHREPAPRDPESKTSRPSGVASKAPAALIRTAAPEKDKRARPGKKGGPPFDPVKENGPIFVDWPKPKLAFVISGRQDGYIEPCGCAGLDRMKGGMSRRYSLFESLESKCWPVIGLDVGGISKGFGRQAELKFHTMIEGMRKTGFNAVGLGTNELQLPAGELVAVTACVDGEQGLFVSANVGLFGFAADVTPKAKYIKAGGMTVGVTSILGTKYQKLIRNDEIEMSDPAKALAEVLVEMKGKADYLVLLAHATREESEKLAAKFPEFHLVVSAGDAAEPPSKPAFIGEAKTMLVEVGEKGMNAVVVGLFDDPKFPVRYQRVPLDSRFPLSDDMKALMRAYQDQLKTLGFAGLNIRPVPHPQAELNGAFVGSKKCESCHEKSCIVWRRSLHSKAYETLANLDPPRQFDPECISCHVIGWHPTKHFPYEGGFRSVEATPDLLDVGCENCHGPGEAHCNAELGKNVELQKKLQKAMVVTKEDSEKRQCYTCHDLDNSPTFDFKTYWPFIEHKEKDVEE